MWFLFGEISSSSGCLGWATLFYCGTPWAFHIIILDEEQLKRREKMSTRDKPAQLDNLTRRLGFQFKLQ